MFSDDAADTAMTSASTTTLDPSYRIPIGLLLVALPMMAVQIWVGAIAALFAVFLGIQAYTLRLVFTDTDLDIYRGETRIRRFPYQDWATWDIFWTPVPILFYFREVNSIHFLPILFNPNTLRQQLQTRIPLNDDRSIAAP
ncbi:MAG: DUF3119 family protein [Cyanobacteria bacterium]|nr:DUF3119 family protein [Cyanobacteriota bacterium]